MKYVAQQCMKKKATPNAVAEENDMAELAHHDLHLPLTLELVLVFCLLFGREEEEAMREAN